MFEVPSCVLLNVLLNVGAQKIREYVQVGVRKKLFALSYFLLPCGSFFLSFSEKKNDKSPVPVTPPACFSELLRASKTRAKSLRWLLVRA